ncbi:MAG: hypothetical protein QOJ92_1144 [Frankiales bacterium]|nr:hypothetical protein [Frankiales bacterium]
MRRSVSSVVLAVVAAGTLIGGLAAPVGASKPASDPTQRVTLVLAPKDRVALRALAMAKGRPTAAGLKAALPSSDAYTKVPSAARALGMTVRSSRRWAIQLEGKRSHILKAFGGNRPGSVPGLLTVPQSMSSYVSLVLDQNAGRGAFKHAVTHPAAPSGDDLRQANGAGPRYAPPSNGTRATIATVQLSDWDSSSLSTYTAASHAADANLPSSVSLVQSDDPFDPAVFDPDGAVEVALDQESVYAVAPSARQRVYTSGNSIGGMLDSIYAIGDDALASEDDNIVAASISWGICESDLGTGSAAGQAAASFLDAVSYATLLGVTVFASSGDEGTTCTSPTRTDGNGDPVVYLNDVSLPASVPTVVSVGGTSGGVPDAAVGLTSWDEADDSSTPANDPRGSGGGSSKLFARPDYQAASVPAATSRQVPDIAALAGDPGFEVYTPTTGWIRVGGTSLASPVSAASLANVVGARAYGLGNILSDLYAAAPSGFVDVTTQGDGGAVGSAKGAAADTAVGYDNATGLGVPKWTTIVPVLTGIPHLSPTRRWTNQVIAGLTIRKSPGASANARYRVADTQYGAADCSITAGETTTANPPTSYDLRGPVQGSVPAHYYDGDYVLAAVEHDGSACRVGYRTITLDTVTPQLSKPVIAVYTGTGNSKLKATWTSSDDGSGIDYHRVVVQRYAPGSSTPVTQKDVQTSATAYIFDGLPGYGYVVTVQVKDRAGNILGAASSKTTAYDNDALGYGGTWTKSISGNDFRGYSRYASAAGQTAARTATGRGYYLLMRTCSICGRATVTVGGVSRTIDLYSSTTKSRVQFFAFSSSGSFARSVVVKVLGTHSSRSKGNLVFIDGMVIQT